ncbi:WD40 repeat domain-containing protein [Zavarzinella formosa]|uniref:WD40 repeat domain-containing protein n=1 Tax=Zavarzinella formosa TaxID=360055 RepID=UPI00030A17AF|nr:PQQ-binding-like beta-propeller repeat protein [Zavarzinella formosa]
MPAKPEQFKTVKEHGFKAICFSLTLRPNTAKVVFGASDFKVYEADFAATKFEPKELYGHESYVTGVALAGTKIVSGGYDCKLSWFDSAANKMIKSETAHGKWIRGVHASKDGKTIVSVGDDMVAKLWDAESGKLLHELKGHAEKTPTNFNSMLYAAAFTDDGKTVATGDKVGKIILWDVATGKKTGELEAPVFYTWDPTARLHSIGGIRSLAFSPDGKTLAVGGSGKIGNIDHLEGKARVELFDVATSKRTWEHQSDKFAGLVNHLQFSPDGSWLLGAGGAAEGFYLMLDPVGKKSIRQEKAGMHIHDVTTTPDMSTLYVAGHNKLAICECKG